MLMSFESRLGAKMRARAAETASSTDGDGSSLIDPSTSTKGNRPAPEGLVIHLDELSEAILSDTSWQDELRTYFEEVLRLTPELNGEPCGTLYGHFTVIK